MRFKAIDWLRRCWTSLLASAILLLSIVPAAHSLYLETSFREMVSSADLIVIATVAETNARWGEQGKMIFTDVRLTDVDTIFNNEAYRNFRNNSLTVTLAGGELDGQGIGTSDTPRFEVGQRVMLYLNQYDGPVITPIVGGMQGVFRVIQDDNTAKEVPLTWIGGGIRAIDQNGKLLVTRPVERVAGGAPRYRAAPLNRQNPALPVAGPGARADARAKLSDKHDARVSAPVKLMDIAELRAEIDAILEQEGRVRGRQRRE